MVGDIFLLKKVSSNTKIKYKTHIIVKSVYTSLQPELKKLSVPTLHNNCEKLKVIFGKRY